MKGKKLIINDYNTPEIINTLKLPVEESSKLLNLGKNSITVLRKEFNILLYKQPSKYIDNSEIDNFTKSLIIGMLLGDSSLSKSGYNRILSTEHSSKQKDYLEFKNNLLVEYNMKTYYRERLDKRTNKIYKSYTSLSNAHLWFNELYHTLYVNGIKTITNEILESLTPQAICLWYLDDGCLRNDKKSKSITISTNCFSDNEIKLIIDYFQNKYNILFKKTPQNAIVFYGKKNIENFMKLFGQFIPKCMEYKFYGVFPKKRYTIGDLHGRYQALREVLKLSMFDYKESKMICLGDIVDGGYNTAQVVEELLKIKNIVFILGNHDVWWMNHLSSGWAEEIWIQQGGANTLRSYGAKVIEADYVSDRSKLDLRGVNVPVTHQDFFNSAVYCHEEDNMVFVHGGINLDVTIKDQKKKYVVWDRSLIEKFRNGKKTTYDKIFIGHTTTQSQVHVKNPGIKDFMKPIHYGKLCMMDCGAGWNGKLAMMNIDTEEVFLSVQQTGGR